MKHVSLKIGALIGSAMIIVVTYYLLLKDTFLHTSISSILNRAQSFTLEGHLLVLGLLPFYIALMVFGAAFLVLYIGSSLLKSKMK